MIIVRLMGGLGNQMFQYAIGRRLALKHGVDLYVDLSWFKGHSLRRYGLSGFRLDTKRLSVDDSEHPRMRWWDRLTPRGLLAPVDRQRPLTTVRESSYEFDPSILASPDDSYLVGYWQSPKYFEPIADVIRRDFSFKTAPKRRDAAVLDRITHADSIAVHVRRGDYVSKPRTSRVHGEMPITYYTKAMEIVSDVVTIPTFFVFSDDPAWCKHNIPPVAETVFVESHDIYKPHEDLRLMIACKHHIIANSSFSWWGAWLGRSENQTVIAPRHWFRDPSKNTRHRLPEAWRTI